MMRVRTSRIDICTVRRTLVAVGLIAAVLVAPDPASAAEQTPVTDPIISTTPDAYLRGAIANAEKRMTGKYTGDGWTWHARFPMDGFIDSYLATKDTAWLDAAAEYFDYNIDLLMTGPDGRRGWLGPAYQMEDKLGEHPIGDAIMVEPMVRFAALVLTDEPALAEKYGDSARSYVELAKELMFDKWESRGIWHVDGPYGAFTEWPWYFTEEEADRWHEPPAGMRAITLPFNMQVHWGAVAAQLYRITGEKAWQTKACRLFNFMKSRLCLYDGHYTWNYWEPFGPWDVDPDNPQAFRHWIGTHGYRDYQAGEIGKVVVAFNHGVTFDAEDMRRFVRTNGAVMWNGDLEDPEWNNSNAGVQKAALGEVRRPSAPRGMFNRYAGTLWTALVQFDPTLRKIYEKQLQPGTYQWAYYHNVTAREPANYDRKHPELPPAVFEQPFNSCSTITMAAVMPSVVDQGEETLVSCQARIPGRLTIELYTEDGKRKLATLAEKDLANAPYIYNLQWTADRDPGRYRVRWTVRGECREFVVEVR